MVPRRGTGLLPNMTVKSTAYADFGWAEDGQSGVENSTAECGSECCVWMGKKGREMGRKGGRIIRFGE